MEVRTNQTVDNPSSTSPQQHHRRTSAAASKQPVSSTNAVDITSVTQRLQKELMALMMSSGDLGVSAFPEGESILTWIGTIKGGEGTMYEGLSYRLSLRFPLDYPFKPPLLMSSSRPCAFILMSISSAIFASTFFRYRILVLVVPSE